MMCALASFAGPGIRFLPSFKKSATSDAGYQLGTANVWSVISVDEARDLIFLADRQYQPGLLRRRAQRKRLLFEFGCCVARVDGSGRLAFSDRASRRVGLRHTRAARVDYSSSEWPRDSRGCGCDQGRPHVRAESRDRQADLPGRRTTCAAEWSRRRTAFPNTAFPGKATRAVSSIAKTRRGFGLS